MALIALLFAHHGAGPEGEPPAAWPVAGVTVIERQVRQARDCGATRVLVVVERMPPGLAAALDRADVEVVRVATGARIVADDRVLLLADSLIVDMRTVAAVLAKDAPALAVWKGRGAHDGAERLDPSTHWAGVALYPGRLVANTLASLGDWDLQATLLRAAYADGRPARVDVATLEADGATVVWRPIRTADEARDATRLYIAAGETEPRDWPSRWVHAPIEEALLAPLLARHVDSRLFLAGATLCASCATLSFVMGWRWAGLILAILSGPLLGLARRLTHARAGQGRESRWTRLDLILSASWYLALAVSFVSFHEAAAPWTACALILVGLWGNVSIRETYRQLTGLSFDEAGLFERRLRLFGAHRNTKPWSLLPFAAVDAWWIGFLWLAVYATITFVLSQSRLSVRLRERTSTPAQRTRHPAASDPSLAFEGFETPTGPS